MAQNFESRISIFPSQGSLTNSLQQSGTSLRSTFLDAMSMAAKMIEQLADEESPLELPLLNKTFAPDQKFSAAAVYGMEVVRSQLESRVESVMRNWTFENSILDKLFNNAG